MGWILLIGIAMLITSWPNVTGPEELVKGRYALMTFFGFWFTVGGILYG